MKKPEDFCHLHTHSDNSNLDGLGKIPDYVNKAARRQNPAIAFTDHGTMRGYLSQHEACEKAGIKPIYGCEFYISPDMRRRGLGEEEKRAIVADLPKAKHRAAIVEYEEKIGLRDRWHLSVWAKNQEGLRNLYRLTSAAWIDGFYYKPRIDMKALRENSAGLMVATGCLSSPIHEQDRSGKKRASLAFADELYEEFGDRMWLEVMPHRIKIQRQANALALKLRDRYSDARLLATQDAHYVNQKDAAHHDCLLCIGTGSTLDAEDRFRFDGDEFYLKSRKALRNTFEDAHSFMPSQAIKESLDSTVLFAERCNAVVEVDYKKALLPDAGIPADFGSDAFGYLKKLCLDGWKWRKIAKRAKSYALANGIEGSAVGLYAERLKTELRLIRSLKFSRYFLIVVDIYREARKRGVMLGPGRGSVGGSLVAYLLGITAMDPLEHGLLFERFINKGRKDLPDIDMDFEDARRGEMIQYMRDRYGEDRVCQIATIGKLSGKSCFKDVCRVVGVPYVQANSLTPSIIHREKHDPGEFNCVADSFKQYDSLKKFDRQYPSVLGFARSLEGTKKTLGIHAAGVIASPVPLRDIMPLEVRTKDSDKVIVSAIDMEDIAKLGLVKLDFLGLKTLTVLRKALEAIKERKGVEIDFESTDFDIQDAKTLNGFTQHDFVGVFQFDSASAYSVCRDIKFDRFSDIPTMTAINRPGALQNGMDEQFRKRKKSAKLAASHEFHPIVSEITANALGVMCYQEHVLQIFQMVGGFSAEDSDKVRKAIGKKLSSEEINKYRAGFVEGAAKVGVKGSVANRLMDAMVKHSAYSFNLSHSVAYGLIAYYCMFLKVHYPVEFFWALLWTESDKDKIKGYATEAKRRGIPVLAADVNISGPNFVLDGDSIRGGLIDIKGVGSGSVITIQQAQPFRHFTDFALRIERRKCNRGQVLSLAKAGAFGSMINLKWLIENMDDYWKLLSKFPKGKPKAARIEARKDLQRMVLLGKREEKYEREDLVLYAAEQNPIAFDAHPLDAYQAFIDRTIRVKIETMGEGYFKRVGRRGHFVIGIIKDVRSKQIGDYGDVDQKDPHFGKPFANVNIEDSSGVERRVKFDHYVHPANQGAIDAGKGKPILCHVEPNPNPKYQSLRATFAIDLAALRLKLKAKADLTQWEKIVVGKHPAKSRAWKTESLRGRWQSNAETESRGSGFFGGIVTHINERPDKNGRRMASIGLLDPKGGYAGVLVFSSVWAQIRAVVRVGKLARLPMNSKGEGGKRSRGKTWIAAPGKVVTYSLDV